MSDIQKITLDNGVRVLVESVGHVKSAAIGLWCKTGSRHEHDSEAGITHLIEHMLFKGTQNRTAKEIAEAIEGRGGSLNAFTDKESTCYYCRTLADDVANGVDVLSDMMLHSLIDPDELKREEGVVLEEIKRSEDSSNRARSRSRVASREPLGRPPARKPDYWDARIGQLFQAGTSAKVLGSSVSCRKRAALSRRKRQFGRRASGGGSYFGEDSTHQSQDSEPFSSVWRGIGQPGGEGR